GRGAPGRTAAPRPETPPRRGEADRVVVVETMLPLHAGAGPAGSDAQGARQPGRAALVAGRVTRLGTVDPSHSRPPPAGPGFLSATVLDVEGPALLLDA